MTDDLISTGQAARILNTSRWTIIRRVNRGELEPVAHNGNGYVFDRATIEALRGAA